MTTSAQQQDLVTHLALSYASDALTNAFLKSVWKKMVRKSDPSAEVLHVDLPQQVFIDSFLKKLDDGGFGRFFYTKTNKHTIQCKCERHSKTRRNPKSSTAANTRANACKAYVSFHFVEENGRKACVVRKQLKHNNHDFTDLEESKVDRIHPELVKLLKELGTQNFTTSQLMVAAAQWSGEQGHSDFRERRYYPSIRDITYLKKRGPREKQNEEDIYGQEKVGREYKIEGVDKLLGGRLKDHVVYLQNHETGVKNEMVLLLQTAYQKELVIKYGQQLCLIIQSNKDDMHYSYGVHTLAVHDEAGQALPAGFIVSTTEQSELLINCFVAFKQANPSFSPRAFVVDPDYFMMEALTSVWPQASLLYCWFHVVQAVAEWMMKRTQGTDDKMWKSCMQVLRKLKDLRHCNKEEEFDNLVSTISTCPAVVKLGMAAYLQVQWLSVSERWAFYGRPYLLEDPDTNGNVERLYLRLKHKLLRGISHRPISNTLILLCEDGVLEYFSYLGSLRQVGRLQNKEAMVEAEKFLNSDDPHEVIINGANGTTDIISGQGINKVHVLELLCDCKASVKADLCVHVYIGLTEATKVNFDLENAREALAKKCFMTKRFVRDGSQIVIISPSSGSLSSVDVDAEFCSCVAHSHGVECFCMRVAKDVVSDINPVVPYLREDDDSDDEIYAALEGMETEGVIEETEEQPSTIQMIQDLFTWGNSDQFRDSFRIREHVKRAHALAFASTSEGLGKATMVTAVETPVTSNIVNNLASEYVVEVSSASTFNFQEWMSMQTQT